jgi:hypothetical protein
MHEELLHDPELATRLAQFATKPRRDRDEFSPVARLVATGPPPGIPVSYRTLGLQAMYGGLAKLHPDAAIGLDYGTGRRSPSSIVDTEWCRRRKGHRWVLRCKGRYLARLPQHHNTAAYELPWFSVYFALHRAEAHDRYGVPVFEHPSPADWRPLGGAGRRALLQAAVRPDPSERMLWAYANARMQEHTKREPTPRERERLYSLRLRLAAKLLQELREPGLVQLIMQTMGGGVDWIIMDRGLRDNVLTTDDDGRVVYRHGNLAASPCGVGFSQHNTKDELLHLASHTIDPDDQPDPMWDKPQIARHMLRATQEIEPSHGAAG